MKNCIIVKKSGNPSGYEGENMTLKYARVELARRLKNFRSNNPHGKFDLKIAKLIK